MFWGWACAGLLLLTACGDDPAEQDNPPRRDVTMTSCAPDTIGITAEGEIVNHSSERSNYTIAVNFYDENRVQVADGYDFVNNVAPDATATWDASGFTDTGVRCEIVRVRRFAS